MRGRGEREREGEAGERAGGRGQKGGRGRGEKVVGVGGSGQKEEGLIKGCHTALKVSFRRTTLKISCLCLVLAADRYKGEVFRQH